jgi:acetyl esterase/lipase
VTARRYLGVIHGFASLPYATPLANRALGDVAADLRAALAA